MTKLILFIILILIPYSSAKGESIRDLAEQKLKNLNPDNAELVFEKISLNPVIMNKIASQCKQKFFRNELYTWQVQVKDSTITYAFLDNVYGKTQPITFLVLLNNKGNIKQVSIIKYRSSHGGAVQNENWLNQFTGMNNASGFKPGKDIDVISGATISVNALSKGVRKIVLLFDELYLSKQQLK